LSILLGGITQHRQARSAPCCVGNDALRWRDALGKNAWRLLCELAQHGGLTAAELARALGVHRTTTQRLLRKCREHDLAACDDGGRRRRWWLGDNAKKRLTEGDVARACGVVDKGADARRKDEAERWRYAWSRKRFHAERAQRREVELRDFFEHSTFELPSRVLGGAEDLAYLFGRRRRLKPTSGRGLGVDRDERAPSGDPA